MTPSSLLALDSPFRRPTIKSKRQGNVKWGMGGTVEGQGSTRSWRNISKNCLTCPPLKAGTISSPVSLPATQRGFLVILYLILSNQSLPFRWSYLFLPKNRSPKFEEQHKYYRLKHVRNTWSLNSFTTWGRWLFFSANEHATPREDKWLCTEKTRELWCLFLYNKSSHTSICMCQVCNLIKGTQSDGSFWSCIPSRPLADADALCGWDSLWDESTVFRESATYVWAVKDLPQCFWLHNRIPKQKV